jgi:hypothetical protein
MMYLSPAYHSYYSPEKNNVKYNELIALDEVEALHFRYDYTQLDVYAALKTYLEQTNHWMYDGNGRWSTSDRMVRLRSDGQKFFLEVWLISGDVQPIDKLEADDTLIKRLRKYGI